ncbi:MAG: NHLP family bacteriocin export ABC transporter peptidase/permease/ATPase subunit [Arenicellales bacterium]|jgi:ATP-binding cassette subfamily C protein|nr:NHLP family bacteriocin export ABC transporter peptidase/permease/ATPase subunit [Arenicellales bacterium]MDP6289356.1 NHLP family bacteriocin export ABC transporter peptidase/permease/ATPase subunit [Arenicellales bacterium]MDP7156589.1 NHLP family bacteriocin export ABC transporter peptidase/permease/ATPase subunit [Arenicellales bacterium]|tara:strand:+ start:751 stop:2940 length:2190 start_codon:yes stop_codon:yes gene_type:complete
MKRIKTPMLLQLEMTECGAASLGIILAYFGKVVPLTELREACGVSRDGVKASNIVRAARQYCFKAKGLKVALNELDELKFPFVVFWDFNHFLVVEGIDRSKDIVYLNDPAHGHRKVSFSEFDEGYTGVVLSFEPDDNFLPGGKRPSLIRAIKDRIRHSGSAIPNLLGAGLLLTIPGLFIPVFTQIYLDQILAEQRFEWLMPLLFVLGLTVLFKMVAEATKFVFLRRLRMHLAISMSSQFFWHLLRLPSGYYSQRYTGEIASRQGLNDGLAEILSGRIAGTVLSIVMMVFYLILLLSYNVALTLLGITFAGINFLALRLLRTKRIDANLRLMQDFGKVSGDSIAALQSMETLKAAGQESRFFHRWSGRYSKAINSMQELEMSTQILGLLPILLNSLNTMIIYLLGGLAVIDGEMSIGTLVAFTALMASFQAPVGNLVSLGAEIQELEGDLLRVDDVLGASLDKEAPSGSPSENEITDKEWPLSLNGRVTVADLTFGYSPLEPPLFDYLSLNIEPGRRVALVGGSGSGKTTLAHLISGLYQPWSGKVLLDGIDRTEIPRSVIVSSLAVVSQDIFLFEGTIRDNLTLWDSTIPDDTLIRACTDAEILETVLALQGGLDGKVIEGGANLSGGQCQRLEIARALVRNPSILVLDEATSALDAETEHLITERLMARGCTSIIVAHRLSTIRDCDEIILLEEGQIIEQGTHAKLWEQKGHYRALLEAGEGPEESDE